METYALRLTQDTWTALGGDPEAKQPVELVVRSIDQPVLAATGETPDGPDVEPVEVPQGQGRRLVGRFFFVRPTEPGRPCRVTHRGLLA